MNFLIVFMVLAIVALAAKLDSGESSLQPDFYAKSCPNLEAVVNMAIGQAMKDDHRMPASLVRLFFHDCFVQGCDASILLDDFPNNQGEKNAPGNAKSVRGYEFIDSIKGQLEHYYPSTVSCADILALAARDATFLSGGPSWPVMLGRRDALTANSTLVEASLPSPFSNMSALTLSFSDQGLDATDLVALSGAHTFGLARCLFVKKRLYNFTEDGKPDPSMDPNYRSKLMSICPENGDRQTLTNFDPSTPNLFDNAYFQLLTKSQGFLTSDQELYSSPMASTKALVQSFSLNQNLFFDHFALSMIKLGNIRPLTGTSGEIRLKCSRVNK